MTRYEQIKQMNEDELVEYLGHITHITVISILKVWKAHNPTSREIINEILGWKNEVGYTCEILAWRTELNDETPIENAEN